MSSSSLIGRRCRSPRRLAAAGIAGALGLFLAACGDEAETVRVRRGDLSLKVEVAGTLEAERSTQLGPPPVPQLWQFKITQLAAEGSAVKTGQAVLGFDPSELARELEMKSDEAATATKELEKRSAELEAEAQDAALALAEAQAQLRKAELATAVPEELAARRELARARLDLDLARRGVAYRERRQVDARRAGEAELEMLRSRRDRAAGRVAEIERSIGRMTVTAPRDGTVIYLTSRGRDEKPKVGDSAWRGRMLVAIPDLSRMRGDGQVPEADGGRIAVGQPVELRLDAHPDRTFAGQVAAIARTVARAASGEPGKVVRVKLALAETDAERMRPGMRFRGSIEVERRRAVLLLAQRAVVASATGPRVRVRDGVGERLRPVRLGARDDEEVEVLEGLSEGDVVLLGAGASTADGAAAPAGAAG